LVAKLLLRHRICVTPLILAKAKKARAVREILLTCLVRKPARCPRFAQKAALLLRRAKDSTCSHVSISALKILQRTRISLSPDVDALISKLGAQTLHIAPALLVETAHKGILNPLPIC
jgi:hypothetical protein